ncbi:hypothetical protein [Nocardia transvalensis]|uniref:hypothetical protein n=1 Tax=Nocardia transvalensis TaxID=37333 RepID=UPI001894A5F6|nr:hypothetical protein [Nocardia transvalensis]MBF6331398.1 hypothetical protein [Nocardia transvalensis]
MPGTPTWVRRNRFVAWASYFCVLIGFATLALAITAAGNGNYRWALLAGGICAATALVGGTLLATTVHRDHAEHHSPPNLLNDTWERTPAYARRRGAPPETRPRRNG